MMVKVKEVFPSMPDELAMKLVSDLHVLKGPYMGIQLPWNRRTRKRLMTAKNIVIHMFSGADTQYWERRLANEHTEVLCVDLNATISANVLDDVTFAYLLSLFASGRVKALIGGPPCRTVSALRFQNDDGPPVLRTEEHPYGLLSLAPQQAELVFNDSVLCRFLLMYIMCEEVAMKRKKPLRLLSSNLKTQKTTGLKRKSGRKVSCQCGELRYGWTLPRPMVLISPVLIKDQWGMNAESPRRWR